MKVQVMILETSFVSVTKFLKPITYVFLGLSPFSGQSIDFFLKLKTIEQNQFCSLLCYILCIMLYQSNFQG